MRLTVTKVVFESILELLPRLTSWRLTVTKVVFEFVGGVFFNEALAINSNKGCFWITLLVLFVPLFLRLTVTKVVFEFAMVKSSACLYSRLTVTKVVFELKKYTLLKK